MLSEKTKKNILTKLLQQYEIYTLIIEEIRVEKISLIKSDINSEKQKITDKISFLNQVLQKTSDEMTFPTPSIWMMYKFVAYKNTDKQITTVRDFIDHCTPEGYICTKRYIFLKKYLDMNNYNLADSLENIFVSNELLNLEQNNVFMCEWLNNEFRITENKVAKWE